VTRSHTHGAAAGLPISLRENRRRHRDPRWLDPAGGTAAVLREDAAARQAAPSRFSCAGRRRRESATGASRGTNTEPATGHDSPTSILCLQCLSRVPLFPPSPMTRMEKRRTVRSDRSPHGTERSPGRAAGGRRARRIAQGVTLTTLAVTAS
jgi:hypothetical protein